MLRYIIYIHIRHFYCPHRRIRSTHVVYVWQTECRTRNRPVPHLKSNCDRIQIWGISIISPIIFWIYYLDQKSRQLNNRRSEFLSFQSNLDRLMNHLLGSKMVNLFGYLIYYILWLRWETILIIIILQQNAIAVVV